MIGTTIGDCFIQGVWLNDLRRSLLWVVLLGHFTERPRGWVYMPDCGDKSIIQYPLKSLDETSIENSAKQQPRGNKQETITPYFRVIKVGGWLWNQMRTKAVSIYRNFHPQSDVMSSPFRPGYCNEPSQPTKSSFPLGPGHPLT